MPDFEKLLNDISNKDWSFAEVPVTAQNENDRPMPWMLQSSANVACEILKEYHNWLLSNYNITPKN